MRIHDVVLNECVPSLNEAADSLVDCDLRNVIQRIKQLIDMCLREKHAPNQKHQDLLGQLGVHRAVIRFLFLEFHPFWVLLKGSSVYRD